MNTNTSETLPLKLASVNDSNKSIKTRTTQFNRKEISTVMATRQFKNLLGFYIWFMAFTTLITIYYGSIECEAYPMMIPRKYPVNVEVENPEELISTLDNLIQNILVGIESTHSATINEKSAANKRGIDLGLSRGFSGSQAAKHLMGMSAASFANGPGRRR